MTELKTLNDLEIDVDNTIMIDELKAEAVKWVKYLGAKGLTGNTPNYDLNRADMLIEFFDLTDDDLNEQEKKEKMKKYKEQDKKGLCKCGHNHVQYVGDLGKDHDEEGYDLITECCYCDCENFSKEQDKEK